MKSYEFELFIIINRHEDPSFPRKMCGYIVMQLTWICLLNSLKLPICFVYIFRIPRSREPIRMPFLSQKHEFQITQLVPWSRFPFFNRQIIANSTFSVCVCVWFDLHVQRTGTNIMLLQFKGKITFFLNIKKTLNPIQPPFSRTLIITIYYVFSVWFP